MMRPVARSDISANEVSRNIRFVILAMGYYVSITTVIDSYSCTFCNHQRFTPVVTKSKGVVQKVQLCSTKCLVVFGRRYTI